MSNLKMVSSTREEAMSLYSTPAIDVASRLAAMRDQERSHPYRRRDYLAGNDLSSTFTERHLQSRTKMCDWCHRLADAAGVSRLAVSRGMGYLDGFLASGHSRARPALVDRREYQLAAMTCLYISIKMSGPKHATAEILPALAGISQGCYTTSEILDMERSILSALQWKLSGPTPEEYVCLMLGLLPPESYDYDPDTLGILLDVSKFQCELSASRYDLSVHDPSVVAIAALLNSLDGTDEELLPTKARIAFLNLIYSTMPGMDVATVGCVQTRLRQLFCQTWHRSDGNGSATSEGEMSAYSRSRSLSPVSVFSVEY